MLRALQTMLGREVVGTWYQILKAEMAWARSFVTALRKQRIDRFDDNETHAGKILRFDLARFIDATTTPPASFGRGSRPFLRESFPLAVLGLKRTLPPLTLRFPLLPPSPTVFIAQGFGSSPRVGPARHVVVIRRCFAASNGVLSHVANSSEPMGRLVPVRTGHHAFDRLHAQRLRATNHSSSEPVPIATALGPE